MANKLFVANLSSRIRRRDLEEEFEKFGKVTDVTIKDGRHIFAFVEFELARDA